MTPQKTPIDVGQAMTVPWNLPGGRNLMVRIVLWGAALLMGVYAVFGAKFFKAYAELLIVSNEMQNAPTDDPEAVMEMMQQLGSFYASMLFITIFAWLIMVSMETAMHKNVFRGTDHGVFPLRFGMDELRVLVTQFVIFVCVFAFYIIGLIAVVAIGAGLAALSPVLGVVVGLFGFVAWLVVLVMISVRWSPASALSVRDEGFRIFDGWAITKGRFWPMFGAFFVLFFGGSIVLYAVMGIGTILAFGGTDFISLLLGTSDDAEAVLTSLGEIIKTPRVMFVLIITTILYAVSAMIMYMMIWGVGNYVAQADARDGTIV